MAIRKNERVLNLLAYLLRADFVVPCQEICDNVEGYGGGDGSDAKVRRRFERDKQALRELGVNILYQYDGLLDVWGYLVPKQNAYMGGIKLDPEEADLLMVLADFAAESDGPLAENLAGACQKLLAQGPLPESDKALHGKHLLVLPHTSTDSRLSGNLQLLAVAVEERRRVTFAYYSIARGSTKRRHVEPYGLKFCRGFWYLVGKCQQSNEIRVFRLDRVRGPASFAVRDGGHQYDIPDSFTIEDYVCRGPWELSSDRPTKVTLDLDETATWLLEETEAARLRLRKGGDGTSHVEVMVSNETGFFKWLVALGTHARILTPRAMIERYKAFLEKVAAAWQA